jgi:hypothetical protein
LAKVVFEFDEVGGDAAQSLGGNTGLGLKELEAVGDGASRAAVFARELRNGQFFGSRAQMPAGGRQEDKRLTQPGNEHANSEQRFPTETKGFP